MSQDCVIGIYKELNQAAQAIRGLEEAGLPHAQVSLLTIRSEEELHEFTAVRHGDAAEQASVAGAATGGLMGLLVSTPLLAVPGLGLALAAGPIAMGLTGAVVGGLVGSMSGWGIDSDHAKRYQQDLEAGKVLIVVNGSPLEVANAERVFRENHAPQVHTHAETSADAKEIVDTPHTTS
jgi:hypothetical protein